jgi:hypothetical protein
MHSCCRRDNVQAGNAIQDAAYCRYGYLVGDNECGFVQTQTGGSKEMRVAFLFGESLVEY